MTGSGKTLAFVIPIIELLLKREEKLKKMQVRTEWCISLVYIYYILEGASGCLEGFVASGAACFCRLGPWWSLPHENWLFRSVRWWDGFYKASPSLRESSFLKFYSSPLSGFSTTRQPGGDGSNLVTQHNLSQQPGTKWSPVDSHGCFAQV